MGKKTIPEIKEIEVFRTGKGGAILCHMSIRETELKNKGKSDTYVRKELLEYIKKLQEELKDGVYEISKDPTDRYINYIGPGELPDLERERRIRILKARRFGK